MPIATPTPTSTLSPYSHSHSQSTLTKTRVTLDPFPAWPDHQKGTFLQFEPLHETEHNILGLQHYEFPVLDSSGNEVGVTMHDRDVVLKKASAPAVLDMNDWVQVLEEPVDLAGMKYWKVVRVKYRHKQTGEVVWREVGTEQPAVFPGGAIIQPYIQYEDGSQALLYLEEWRAETGKVVITFPDGMMDLLPDGRQETPIAAALRELAEEGGVVSNDKISITMLDYWQKDGGLPGMGQLRHFFRVAIHGLEKGVVPTPKPELDERLVVKLVPVDSNLKRHFDRYTEENGYQVRGEFQEEIDWITKNLL